MVPLLMMEYSRLISSCLALLAGAVFSPSASASPGSEAVSRATPQRAPAPPGVATAYDSGNPYSFYGSVAECAAAERTRCEACLNDGSCTAITGGDGNAECSALGADSGRGYSLICINLSLSIDAVSSCAASSAPVCPRDTQASESLDTLSNNADFLDVAGCAKALDACLASLYGPSQGGTGSGAVDPPPRHTSFDCSSWEDDPNSDSDIECDADGPSCDGSQADGGACDSSDESSGCDGGSGGDAGGGGGGCGNDGEDACGSENASGCDNGDGGSDCGGGGGGGGDCGGGGGGGDCGGGGGGGDCGGGGGGGDCGGGGGGDCNVTARHHPGGHGGGMLTILWAFLPLPFAVLVKRRARRRRDIAAAASNDHAFDGDANGRVPDREAPNSGAPDREVPSSAPDHEEPDGDAPDRHGEVAP
jgi:hypothetical protein